MGEDTVTRVDEVEGESEGDTATMDVDNTVSTATGVAELKKGFQQWGYAGYVHLATSCAKKVLYK